MISIKLNAQSDGYYVSYLLLDLKDELDVMFTAPTGNLSVTDTTGTVRKAAQTLVIDCYGMTVGNLYVLPVG